MKRREFITLVGGAAAAWPLAARAQQAGKNRIRIGILSIAGNPASSLFANFHRELNKRGYMEGGTVVTEFRSAGGDLSQLPVLAAELVRLPVDILVTDGGLAAIAAKNATTVIPIIMATVGDPITQGIVDSLARPSGNITGFTLFSLELSTKRLELLKEIAPALRRVAVLWNPVNSGPQYAATEEAARALGLQLESGEAESRPKVSAALSSLKQRNVSALIVLPDGLFWNERVTVVTHATAARWPSIFPEREYADVGGLLAYGPNVAENFRRAAGYVDRIIKGAKTLDLPIEQPTKFELVINLNTAKALGLDVPTTLLALADEVIE